MHFTRFHKETILWSLFVLNGCAMALGLWNTNLRIQIPPNPLVLGFALVISLLLLIVHSVWTLGRGRAFIFVLLCALIALAAEHIGLVGGTLFGGQYMYQLPGPTFWQVPLLIIIFWIAFIYTGYNITNSFLYWLGKTKPSISKYRLGLVLGLVILDASLVTALDLFMDPLAVGTGMWIWKTGGSYFGVPLGNFVGWFLTTVLATGLFRLLEYYYPRTEPLLSLPVFLASTLGYGCLGLTFLLASLAQHHYSLAVIGGTLMFGITAVNILLFARAILKDRK